MTRQILTTFLLFSTISLLAQESAKPFRKANTIVAYTNLTDSANFHNFKKQLLKYDYFVNKSDADLIVLKTDYHELKKHPGWSYSYSFKILFQDKKIIIKPFWKTGVLIPDDPIRWHYANSNGNIQNMIWHDVLGLLNNYPHSKIIYKRE